MIESRASNKVKEAMGEGKNCCEAVLMAGNEVFNLNLKAETLATAKIFQEGLASGCICGALVGMVMVSGILQDKTHHPLGNKLSGKLHDRFKEEFGSTCCRVIKKARPVWQQIGKKACIDLSARAATILVEEWRAIIIDHN